MTLSTLLFCTTSLTVTLELITLSGRALARRAGGQNVHWKGNVSSTPHIIKRDTRMSWMHIKQRPVRLWLQILALEQQADTHKHW